MTATDPRHAALLAAVLAAPDDDLPRLVLADWLEEHGEPERAEFVRVQCELARLPEPEIKTIRPGPDDIDHPNGYCPQCRKAGVRTRCHYHALRGRERELWMSRGWSHLPSDWQPSFSVHIDQTLPRDAGGATVAVVRRGFVAEYSGPSQSWFAVCVDLAACQPITRLRLTDMPTMMSYHNPVDRTLTLSLADAPESLPGNRFEIDLRANPRWHELNRLNMVEVLLRQVFPRLTIAMPPEFYYNPPPPWPQP